MKSPVFTAIPTWLTYHSDSLDMDSYPWEAAQTTSGIVKDPSLGKRVVPPSVRKDGR